VRLGALLLAAISIGGCAAEADHCRGHQGTCIGVTTRATGVVIHIDQLHVELRTSDHESVKVVRADTPATPGTLVTLPATSAFYPAPDVAGPSTLAVQARSQGRVIGGGSAAVNVASGGHYEVEIDLAGVPGGVAPCPNDGGVEICDDFEADGTPTSAVYKQWTPSQPFVVDNPGTPTLALDAAEVFRGSYALRASSGGGGMVLLNRGFMPAVTGGVVAVRGYVYDLTPLVDLTAFFQLEMGNQSVRVGAGNSGPNLKDAGYWQLSQDVFDPVRGGPIPLGGWLCVELVVDLDQRQASLYATDAFAPGRSAPPVLSRSIVSAPITGVSIGMPWAPAADETLWIDDVAVGRGRLGCE
jgi:hypothetical protein